LPRSANHGVNGPTSKTSKCILALVYPPRLLSCPLPTFDLNFNFGKLERLADKCAAVGPPLLECVAYVGTTKISFLVDTGVSVSIIPKRFLTGVVMYPTAVRLQTATGEPIKISGEVCL
jgi:hypothetical protein